MKDRYLGLDEKTYKQILQNLRPSHILVGPVEAELPAHGEHLFSLVESLLSDKGWMREGLRTRWIGAKRLGLSLVTGTDRDITSSIYHHSGADGEVLAMKENGLHPRLDLDLVTYVGNLRNLTQYTMPALTDRGLLIYAPEALKSIQPSKNKTGSFSNGFHMFLDRRLIEPSLLVVLRPYGTPPTSVSDYAKMPDYSWLRNISFSSNSTEV